MKILHSADFHLDAPFSGRSDGETAFLRRELLEVPGRIADICAAEKCDLVLLSGDLFDGAYSRESYLALYEAMERMTVPVFVSPGNHDFCGLDSPWNREKWPKNVHIFMQQRMEAVEIPSLDCTVYGAGYQSMDCPGLLENFRAAGECRYQIAVLHGDPTQQNSPYCPVTAAQIQNSGLDHLALGHIHKGGSLHAGKTLCAWPGCPMGRGYDETGVKGVYIVDLETEQPLRFLPLATPRFYDLETDAGRHPVDAVRRMLPAAASSDFYRITLTGYASHVDLEEIGLQLSDYPNLKLRDKTIPEADLWGAAGEDSLEGVYFRMLQEAMADQDGETCGKIRLAAEISRMILDGQEVKLP